MAAVLETASSSPAGSAELPRTDAYYRLRADVEDFLYSEADLLDERRFRDWLNLLADDISYFMPIRRNVKFGQHNDRENTRTGMGISWFDEDKWTLTKRVDQILTGVHFAEEPLSRVCHMISNVQIRKVLPSLDDPREVGAQQFLPRHQALSVQRLHRHRREPTLVGVDPCRAALRDEAFEGLVE